MSEDDAKRRRFPLQCDVRDERGRTRLSYPRWTYWAIAEQAYKRYAELFGTGQSLERLADRCGFGWAEIDWLLSGLPFSESGADKDARAAEDVEFERAGGGVTCDRCNLVYADHLAHPYLTWLTRLCDGRLVKL